MTALTYAELVFVEFAVRDIFNHCEGHCFTLPDGDYVSSEQFSNILTVLARLRQRAAELELQ